MAEKIKVGDTVVCIDVGRSYGIPHTADTQAIHLGCQYTVSKVYELSNGTVHGVFLNNYHGGWWLATMFEKYQKPEPTPVEWFRQWSRARSMMHTAQEQVTEACDKLADLGYTMEHLGDGEYGWVRHVKEVLK